MAVIQYSTSLPSLIWTMRGINCNSIVVFWPSIAERWPSTLDEYRFASDLPRFHIVSRRRLIAALDGSSASLHQCWSIDSSTSTFWQSRRTNCGARPKISLHHRSANFSIFYPTTLATSNWFNVISRNWLHCSMQSAEVTSYRIIRLRWAYHANESFWPQNPIIGL